MYVVGDTIDDLQFLLPSGEPVRLAQLSSGKLILIFYRHLM